MPQRLLIENNAVSLFGAIQADRLADFKGLEKDGLIQRFAPILASAGNKGRRDIHVRGRDAMDRAILRLCDMEAEEYTADTEGVALIKQTWDRGLDYQTVTDYGVGFQGFCGKLHGTHARLSLVLHLLDAAVGNQTPSKMIPAATIERAGWLTHDFILPHARNFHASVPGAAHSILQDVAGWVLTKAPRRILASDLTTGIWTCRGLGLRDIQRILDPLVTGGWIEPETQLPTNKAWTVHPALHDAFIERSHAEQERRAESRRLVAMIGRRGRES